MRRALPALFFAASSLLAQVPAPLTGAFHLVSAVDLTRGIHQVTEDLPMFERFYARQRLASVNPLYRVIRVAPVEGGLDLAFDGRAPLHLQEGHDIAWVREDGEPFSVRLTTQGRRFTQVYRGRDGQRTNAFYLTPSGQALVLEVTVKSHKLAKALHYHLVYEKAQGV